MIPEFVHVTFAILNDEGPAVLAEFSSYAIVLDEDFGRARGEVVHA